jgi:hypothetical protein
MGMLAVKMLDARSGDLITGIQYQVSSIQDLLLPPIIFALTSGKLKRTKNVSKQRVNRR